MPEHADVAIIGAGAAGLMAAIWAGRTAQRAGVARRIFLLDGAKHIGAKILIAGGGRCNVTHDVVDEAAYAGSSRHAIRKVLKRFDVPRTIAFFHELGVELKREETGKLFPTTDQARTVLASLLRGAQRAGVELWHPWRVVQTRLVRAKDGLARSIFELIAEDGRALTAERTVLATGGKSLPKTGSDGAGYDLARAFGHSITPRIFPALVPLLLPKEHPLCALSGISAVATLEVRSGSGKRLATFTDSTLCTHFGLSGPCPLDISRYWNAARFDDPETHLVVNWLPKESVESFDRVLIDRSRGPRAISAGRILREHGLPARLADVLCTVAGINASVPPNRLSRDQRREVVNSIIGMRLPITGDRGFAHAEVTAGGVPLREIRTESMESRLQPGLHIIGEMCDVDGRIGGYNFQWAWASGHVAGLSCAGLTQ